MAQEIIDIGSIPNDGNGDPLRTAFEKTQNNFDEVYSAFTFFPGTNNVTVANAINIPNAIVDAVYANGSLGTAGYVLTSNGSGVFWGTSAVGSNQQIQFNDSGAINSSPAFYFNKATNNLTVSNTLVISTVNASVGFNIGTTIRANTLGIYSNNVNAATITIGTVLFANSYLLNFANTVNATVFSVGTDFKANSSLVTANAMTLVSNVLTIGSGAYFVSNGNLGLGGNDSPSETLTVDGTASFTGNVILENTGALIANGSPGTAGYVLVSNGSSAYWDALSSLPFTDAAQYTFTNTITFSNTITFDTAIVANGTTGTAGYVLTTSGTDTYWAPAPNSSAQFNFTNTVSFSNGVLSNGAFTGSYTSGAVVDYVSGRGRISVETGAHISFYTGGVGSSNLMTIASNGMLIVPSNNFTLGTSTVSGNGYTYLPNGIKMNWGRVSATKTTGNITFTSAFSTAVYSITATVYGTNAAKDTDHRVRATVSNANNTGAAIRVFSNDPYFVYWIAIGK